MHIAKTGNGCIGEYLHPLYAEVRRLSIGSGQLKNLFIVPRLQDCVELGKR